MTIKFYDNKVFDGGFPEPNCPPTILPKEFERIGSIVVLDLLYLTACDLLKALVNIRSNLV